MSTGASSVDFFPLEKLPAEVLDNILSNLFVSHTVIKLWKSGSRLLQSKLANGITSVDFRGLSILPRFCPPMLSQLRSLRSFSLYSTENLVENPINWPKLLKSLPSSLETLSIVSRDASLALLKHHRLIMPSHGV